MTDAMQSPLFRGIKPADLTALLGCLGAAERRYAKGQVILAEGQPTEQIGLVRTGLVLIENCDVWGSRTILGSAGPGAVFAEAYACTPGEPLRISVTAAEETTVLFLRVGKLLTTCPNGCPFHAQLTRNLLTVCAQKSLQLSRRMLHTSPKTIRGRLLSYFSEQVKVTGSRTFTIPYTRQQLADYLGVDRSALCTALTKMQREGLLRCRRSTFELLE